MRSIIQQALHRIDFEVVEMPQYQSFEQSTTAAVHPSVLAETRNHSQCGELPA